MRRGLARMLTAGALLVTAACTSPARVTQAGPAPSSAPPSPSAPSSPSPSASPSPSGASAEDVLARAKSAFRSAGAVTVTVDSTSEGDASPPFNSWTETVTADGKTTDPPFTGSLAGSDPIDCSDLHTCANFYYDTQGYPLELRDAGPGAAVQIYAVGSADLGLPGWSATVDARTCTPITIVAGWSCSHCYYLTYHFKLTQR